MSSINFNKLLIDLEQALFFGNIKIHTPNTQHLVTCWKETGCKKKRCPAYGKDKIRCWQKHGTFCLPNSSTQGFINKFSDCRKCSVFKNATKNEQLRALEAFHNIKYMLSGSEINIIVLNRELFGKFDLISKRFNLTGREINLLQMALMNEKRINIAKEFSISINTVKTHFRHIFKKIGAHSIEELREMLHKL